jgi:hypothetical protein
MSSQKAKADSMTKTDKPLKNGAVYEVRSPEDLVGAIEAGFVDARPLLRANNRRERLMKKLNLTCCFLASTVIPLNAALLFSVSRNQALPARYFLMAGNGFFLIAMAFFYFVQLYIAKERGWLKKALLVSLPTPLLAIILFFGFWLKH